MTDRDVLTLLALAPSPRVQWRRPGEEEWQTYDPLTTPWDIDIVEVRLLPMPEVPDD